MPLPTKSASFQSKRNCKPFHDDGENGSGRTILRGSGLGFCLFVFLLFWIRNKHYLKDRNLFFFFFNSRSFSESGVNCHKEPSKNIFKMLLLQSPQWYNILTLFGRQYMYYSGLWSWLCVAACFVLVWPWPCLFLSSLLTLKMSMEAIRIAERREQHWNMYII